MKAVTGALSLGTRHYRRAFHRPLVVELSRSKNTGMEAEGRKLEESSGRRAGARSEYWVQLYCESRTRVDTAQEARHGEASPKPHDVLHVNCTTPGGYTADVMYSIGTPYSSRGPYSVLYILQLLCREQLVE